MSTPATTNFPELALPGHTSFAGRLLRAISRFAVQRPLGAVGAGIVIVFLFTAVFAPWIAPYPYDDQSLTQRLQSPSADHLLGTDSLGRDLLSRVIYGARISITIGFSAVAISVALSIALGLPSGYFGGKTDVVIQRVVDILLALPGIVALIFLISVFGSSLFNITVLLGVLGAPAASRVIRSSVMATSQADFIAAARAMGASHLRIMIFHVLPNVIHVVIVGATVSIGAFILAEAGLAFLGLGVPPPFPTWGRMLNVSREYMHSPWMALAPGLALTAAVFAFNVLGDALRDAFDPRMRGS